LNGGYKRQFTAQYTLQITSNQSKAINYIINELKRKGNPNLQAENKLLFSPASLEGQKEAGLGFTADIYKETDTLIEAIEMKSVRPNSGEGRGEKVKILNAKAAFKLLHPTKEIRFYVGFPFDPTSDSPTGYDKERFFKYLIEFKKFFSPEEVLIGSELWNYLSGQQNTMESILDIIKSTVETFAQNTNTSSEEQLSIF
jgi:Type II restriction endonuclease, TdeIII